LAEDFGKDDHMLSNEECAICGAAYHCGRDKTTGKTIKLSRQRHLAHCEKRIEQLIKSGRSSGMLEDHAKKLAWNTR
jgi:hypothetical protein